MLRGVIINAKNCNIFNLNPADNVAIHSHLTSFTDKIEIER